MEKLKDVASIHVAKEWTRRTQFLSSQSPNPWRPEISQPYLYLSFFLSLSLSLSISICIYLSLSLSFSLSLSLSLSWVSCAKKSFTSGLSCPKSTLYYQVSIRKSTLVMVSLSRVLGQAVAVENLWRCLMGYG